MRLLLINPINPLVSVHRTRESRWNKYRIWKPLSLLVLSSLTPPEWDITIIDENLGTPDYSSIPRPDLVGITAFTSQADNAYKIAAGFRNQGIPVIMGGIHATMCQEETLEYVTAVVTGEAESVWAEVLEDARHGALKRVYHGIHLEMDKIPVVRQDWHNLLPNSYHFGSIQTTRGCPLNCSFCSVTAFNGGKFRYRSIDKVIQELKMIREKYVLVVDDNFIGTRREHVEHAKDLLRAMIKAKLGKKWGTQVTINMADDEELLRLASKAGCAAVFIGLESISIEGLKEISKKFNVSNKRDIRDSVRKIKRHGIIVVGSFVMGLDVDKPGIGMEIFKAADYYGVDAINVMFLTPFPGTRLWEKMRSEGRIAANNFPEDWKYYTLIYPVARYKHLSWEDILNENEACEKAFYSYPRMMRQMAGSLLRRRQPMISLAMNLSYRNNGVTNYRKKYKALDLSRGQPVMGREI